MRINEDIDGWMVIGSRLGLRQLAFQRAANWIPPRWPDPACPPQMHLDIHVGDAGQPDRNCSLWAPPVYPVSARRASGFSPTPSATRSASFPATMGQLELGWGSTLPGRSAWRGLRGFIPAC